LITRVADAYFNVLAAKDNVDSQSSAFQAISRQLEQAEKRFEVGLIAITDVQEAKAARDSSAAAVIVAKRTLATAEEALRHKSPATAIKHSRTRRFLAAARTGTRRRKQMDRAGDGTKPRADLEPTRRRHRTRQFARLVRRSFATVDLTATKSDDDQKGPIYFSSGNVGKSASNVDTKLFALQVTMPIFSGGAAQSRVRQSEYQWQAARERLAHDAPDRARGT
jgi:outer membrane protein